MEYYISKVMKMSLALFAVVMLWSTKAIAQSASCTSGLMGLSPCVSYMTGMSPIPAAPCCMQLASMVQNQPQCLCSLLNGSGTSSLGFNLNQTLALQLPGACNVQTPANLCNAAAGPTSAVVAPASSPASSPSGSTGSKTTPTTKASTNGQKVNGGTTINFPVLLFSSAIFASICNAYGFF